MAYEGQPASAFIDTELVQQHLREASVQVAELARIRFVSTYNGMLRSMSSIQFDSPLEMIFWIWWHALTEHAPHADRLDLNSQRDVVVEGKTYRVDFSVDPVESIPGWQPIAVELDGHAFHERTRDQVALRDSRDRALQIAGWRVFHFSFTEFTTNPMMSIADVFVVARDQLLALTRR